MYDAGKIIPGLLIFLALVTIPFWYNIVAGGPVELPELAYPTDETECVYGKDYMRREHMQVLMDWRDEAVRDGDRIFETASGRKFYKSLTGTCIGCHQEPEEFCYKCHEYSGVRTPYCWECHVDQPPAPPVVETMAIERHVEVE